MRIRLSLAMTTAGLLVSMTASAAQEPQNRAVDARWTPFLGCWQQLEESVREETFRHDLDREPRTTAGVVVCVTPASSSSAVTLTTLIEGQSALEETMFADGAAHSISELGCQGSQRADWSSNGRRLFAKAELSCADGTRRSISGLTAIGRNAVWVDIQVVTLNGRESIRVRRYRRAGNQSRVAAVLTKEQLANAAATARSAGAFTLDEVKEATTRSTPAAIEAALVETGSAFPLNARRLQELDAAGVPDRVMDLMIALSFPDKFVVERASWSTSTRAPVDFEPLPWTGGFYDYDLWPYYYSPFGYGMWGRYDTYYYGAPAYVVDVSTPSLQPSGEGRVVDGHGYTRVRSREPQPTAGGSAGGSDGGSFTGGGGGNVSTQGYSGGGGGDGGRTAVARPPK